jgi:hypothetical protein
MAETCTQYVSILVRLCSDDWPGDGLHCGQNRLGPSLGVERHGNPPSVIREPDNHSKWRWVNTRKDNVFHINLTSSIQEHQSFSHPHFVRVLLEFSPTYPFGSVGLSGRFFGRCWIVSMVPGKSATKWIRRHTHR